MLTNIVRKLRGTVSVVVLTASLPLYGASQPGSLDESFDPGTGADSGIWAAGLLPDGRIAITGDFLVFNGIARQRVARLYTNGTIDTDFAPNDGPNWATYALAVQPDYRIVLAGGFGRRVARFTPDGLRDPSFDPIGTGSAANIWLNQVILQPDRKLILAGSFTMFNGIARRNVVRIHSNGDVDESFTPGTGPSTTAHDLELQPDGQIILTGQFTSYNGTPAGRIVRLRSSGLVDPTFNSSP